MEKEKILKLVAKNLNLAGLVADALDELLEPALKKVVERTDNKLDDTLMLAVYPALEEELKKLVKEQLDKLLGSEEKEA